MWIIRIISITTGLCAARRRDAAEPLRPPLRPPDGSNSNEHNVITIIMIISFREISQTTVSTRWPKPKCTIPAWPSQFKIVGC